MRFTYIISALSLGITALAYEIPAACNCNTPGCQYGIGSQGITLQKFSFLAKNGTNNGCRGDVGSKVRQVLLIALYLPKSTDILRTTGNIPVGFRPMPPLRCLWHRYPRHELRI
jgi:hypothetical protein